MDEKRNIAVVEGGVAARKFPLVFFGRCSLLSACVLRELARRENVIAIVESQPRGFRMPRGWRYRLHRRPREHDLARLARALAAPYFLLTPERTGEFAIFLRTLRTRPDVGVIAQMAQLLPEAVISLFPRGVLNVHPSLLPNYRGPNPVFWTYYNEERTSGVTIHFIDAHEDTGDIVKQVELPIAFGESSRSFAKRCAAVAPGLVADALDELRQGTIERHPQCMLPCPVRGRFLKEGESLINWRDWPIERVYHTLRGAEGLVDVLPRRSFPLSLFVWEIVRFEKGAAGAIDDPTITRAGFRFTIAHRDGRIVLRPRFSLVRALRVLRTLRPQKRRE